MSDVLDIYNIILLALAVFVFFKLRSVLGKRTGNERPPFDPYSKPAPDQRQQQQQRDNVIPLPGAATPEASQAETGEVVLDKVAPTGTALNAALRQILSADRSFEPEQFLQGARGAYEMIVTAFAEGDRKTLKQLLSKDVFDGFVTAINEREARGEVIESTFVGINKAEIVEAALKGTTAQVTVRLQSELISATRDRDGHVIDGDPAKVSEVIDIWTFARETNTRDPNWKLVATESAE
ncbi:Tim44/TimA family putative adaptor protein [Microvirga tunisiensis]|uniref:Tim44/TimA family putative adaptor protein n=2 Tax=Pannonibacter tanglangensis TaxID=2750084 RepID=A0A7X5F5H7_9HYPH|nr:MULTISPECIES: Tim44/TimA family putative adaptor protein [unclassified Pannonibacter]NBN65636.1 Tim44/TimA family putative adaptor protein [Pannonibacter sp. XCT-34]NBN80137.1 Tim44/TimA family putative adaptor protein [Pannonibacter sp. XCT-53]